MHPRIYTKVVWEINQGNEEENQKCIRKSDSLIVPKKAVKAVGGKGWTHYSFK